MKHRHNRPTHSFEVDAKVRTRVPGSTPTTWEDKRVTIRLDLDIDWIGRQMANFAAKNKGKRAVKMNGGIVAKIID